MNQNPIADKPPATIRPRYSAFMILPPGRALTKKQPTIEARMEKPPRASGYVTASAASAGSSSAPSSIVATMVTA